MKPWSRERADGIIVGVPPLWRPTLCALGGGGANRCEPPWFAFGTKGSQVRILSPRLLKGAESLGNSSVRALRFCGIGQPAPPAHHFFQEGLRRDGLLRGARPGERVEGGTAGLRRTWGECGGHRGNVGDDIDDGVARLGGLTSLRPVAGADGW